MSDFQLSLLCLLVTLGLYFANKRLYRRFLREGSPISAQGIS